MVQTCSNNQRQAARVYDQEVDRWLRRLMVVPSSGLCPQKRPEHKFGRKAFRPGFGCLFQELIPRHEDVNISHKSLPESSAQSQICTHLDKASWLNWSSVAWIEYSKTMIIRAYARPLQSCKLWAAVTRLEDVERQDRRHATSCFHAPCTGTLPIQSSYLLRTHFTFF